jgi:hypothetical protein
LSKASTPVGGGGEQIAVLARKGAVLPDSTITG